MLKCQLLLVLDVILMARYWLSRDSRIVYASLASARKELLNHLDHFHDVF